MKLAGVRARIGGSLLRLGHNGQRETLRRADEVALQGKDAAFGLDALKTRPNNSEVKV
jgi:hypothetical protein